MRSDEKCGCALASVTPPWVAQRVCAIPVAPLTGYSFNAAASSFTLPIRLVRVRLPWLSKSATPAESYPRYSKRRKPSNNISTTLRSAIAPTIPHILSSNLCCISTDNIYAMLFNLLFECCWYLIIGY